MSRELKFRVWDVEQKRMSNIFSLTGIGIVHFPYPVFDSVPLNFCHDDDRFICMQYTGLKDKNGKEIYECDIIREFIGKQRFILLMTWNSTRATFDLKEGDVWTFSNDPSELGGAEVIGNVHENPELLKGAI